MSSGALCSKIEFSTFYARIYLLNDVNNIKGERRSVRWCFSLQWIQTFDLSLGSYVDISDSLYPYWDKGIENNEEITSVCLSVCRMAYPKFENISVQNTTNRTNPRIDTFEE